VHTLHFAARHYPVDFAIALPALQRLHLSSVEKILPSTSLFVAKSPVSRICALDARDYMPLTGMLLCHLAICADLRRRRLLDARGRISA
jgi:hypothetical protein